MAANAYGALPGGSMLTRHPTRSDQSNAPLSGKTTWSAIVSNRSSTKCPMAVARTGSRSIGGSSPVRREATPSGRGALPASAGDDDAAGGLGAGATGDGEAGPQPGAIAGPMARTHP